MFMWALWVILKQQKLTDLQKDFINNMTHEFKTPISSIKIASDVILDESRNQTPRLHQYAEIIKEQNERLNTQVEKVLNIARLEKDKFKLTFERVDLIHLLNRVVRLEKIRFDEKGGKLELEDPDGSVMIKADKLHLTNVLSNILDNASKYCVDKPKVLIRVETDNKELKLKIIDNGIGIKKENLKNIFDKFFRVSTGNIHDVKGFGLGLFYVKNICDAHGWKINVESNNDQGTEFTILIPVID
jgi:two-component system phosphate regulon sensor histidine kinase PhoR